MVLEGKNDMNVHFFVTYMKDASNSILAQELKRQDVDFAIFSDHISLRYKYRAWLYFVGWPRLLLYSFRSAKKSLKTTPKADWVVLESHLEVLAYIWTTKILGHVKPKIMLLGFIYTARKQAWVSKLKYTYLKYVLNHVDCVVCHSTQETEKNKVVFNLKNTQFSYIPYGLHVSKIQHSENFDNEPYALSAGRSGRDYKLLIQCFTELGYPLRIVCDSVAAIGDQSDLPKNIKILTSCYDAEYLKELTNAKLVVVPLSVDDLSAGQMVLLQSMALKKPVIITKTKTIHHYVEHEKNAVLVEKDSLNQMKEAVKKIWEDKEFAAQLSLNAKSNFDENYSMESFIRKIIHELKKS
jgi:glycosyltransferase involved in cell wall biosynthesis